jgi:hypothetical protein
MKNQIYLGDSVYMHYDDHQLKIYTDNGDGPENTIVLEPEVFAELVRHGNELFNTPKMVVYPIIDPNEMYDDVDNLDDDEDLI